MNFLFYFNSILMGVGLAMDAFSVSLANGLSEPDMKHGKMWGVAGTFAFFQGLMPFLGWLLVHTAQELFSDIAPFIPLVALILLSFIGGKMLYEGIKHRDCDECRPPVGLAALLVQGVATSIDALSVGFTIAGYGLWEALVEALIIALTTLLICYIGIEIGKRAGTRLSGKAGILGGAILIFIGLEIFITSLF